PKAGGYPTRDPGLDCLCSSSSPGSLAALGMTARTANRSGTNSSLEVGEGEPKHRAGVGDLVPDGFELRGRRLPETCETFGDRTDFTSEALAHHVEVTPNLFCGLAVHGVSKLLVSIVASYSLPRVNSMSLGSALQAQVPSMRRHSHQYLPRFFSRAPVSFNVAAS